MMSSQKLQDARLYEERKESRISPLTRPLFHLSARAGWMNDPNGFSYYQGMYHLFYQYHPYDSHWGPMHWGHAVSRDLIRWQYLPAALAPDKPYDIDGCYSGSAITLPDGRQMLMYTGMVYEENEHGERREVQTQCIAIGDGIDYEKYEKNPVLTEKNLPEGGSRYGFRDPKIFRLSDGTYRALIANSHKVNGGQILSYRSRDGLTWEYAGVFAENHNRLGRMWECPDFFELDGQYMLIVSSQDMLPQGLEYHNGNGTVYFTGQFDPRTEMFIERENHAIDYGLDFYAPQTILSPEGRRIMIGWMQNWDTCNLHVKSTPWFGQMSIPRELSMKDGVLIQQPIRELYALRANPVEARDVLVADGEIQIPGVNGRILDLEVQIRPADEEDVYQKFAIRFAMDDIHHTAVSFRPHESIVKIDRKFSGSRRAIIHQRRAYVDHDNGSLKLRIILDRFSAEVFIGDGRKVMSMTIYTDLRAGKIGFFADGKALVSVKKYELLL